MSKKVWNELRDFRTWEEMTDLVNEEADLSNEEEEEGPLAGFERAGENAYDDDFLAEKANDWFEN